MIPYELFRTDVQTKRVEHLIRRPNGTQYEVTCSVSVGGDTATLTYKADENRPDTIWPGTTRIQFETHERKGIQEIGWLDNGAAEFVNLAPVVSLEDCLSTAGRYFTIKAATAELERNTLNLSERPIVKMMGQELSLGDRVFVWNLDENKGIEWYGRVVHLDNRDSNSYRIGLQELRRATKKFGTAELDSCLDSEEPRKRGLYQKLKSYSLRGIRRMSDDEAQELLSLFGIGATERDGENEVARLIRLGKISSRPNQSAFSSQLRDVYGSRCAITGCSVAEALEAAHIKVAKGVDDNELSNGILLRADIHALFDAGLIALTLEGDRLDVSPDLQDPAYEFLRTATIYRPNFNYPSEQNIRHHRLRFGFVCPAKPVSYG